MKGGTHRHGFDFEQELDDLHVDTGGGNRGGFTGRRSLVFNVFLVATRWLGGTSATLGVAAWPGQILIAPGFP